jgi:hypothetical protein
MKRLDRVSNSKIINSIGGGSGTVLLLTVGLVCFVYIFWQTAHVVHVTFSSTSSSSSSTNPSFHRIPEIGAAGTSRSTRRFLNYKASAWEALWLTNIEQWSKEKTICDHIFSAEQADFLHTFQMTLCTHLNVEDTPWCAIDDPYNRTRYFYNTQTREYSISLPQGVSSWNFLETLPPRPIVPIEHDKENPQVFSQFNYVDETTGRIYSEYIEPLVSHLRHPIAKCEGKSQGRLPHGPFIFSRSYIVPLTTKHNFRKKHYFDAGCSTWNDGNGGPSLHYFTTVWKRHGINFDRIEGWEGEGIETIFHASVPEEYKNRTFYHQEFISSSPTTSGTFLPFSIRDTAHKEDYVLLKLDIDNGSVEKGTVKYFLDELPGFYDPDAIQYIDELVWEHHAGGNYLMYDCCWNKTSDNLTLWDSYQIFLKLRNKGVRAHSYV